MPSPTYAEISDMHRDMCRVAGEQAVEIERLRGIILVAHGVIMKATGGDEDGKYERDISKIRAAITKPETV